MKKWIGWILLALSLVITYQGWQNSQPRAETQDMSRPVACEGRAGCTVEGARPQKVATDWLRREYEWKTSTGPVLVRCRRAYVFAGRWACQTAS
ncbi:MAG: hypothetical protein AAGF11_11510 [Myxococcota bacterium]